ncbi:unnamed protein product [Protopolystoma xenopodis]|uniref:Uncharacterized protein n=1 Tax=Protopolystoma xenopodis TaxID=117903 RepID=A0A448XKC4_9PLAT|nr:unnamed protein product [Protopolystoma xenopodis]
MSVVGSIPERSPPGARIIRVEAMLSKLDSIEDVLVEPSNLEYWLGRVTIISSGFVHSTRLTDRNYTSSRRSLPRGMFEVDRTSGWLTIGPAGSLDRMHLLPTDQLLVEVLAILQPTLSSGGYIKMCTINVSYKCKPRYCLDFKDFDLHWLKLI